MKPYRVVQFGLGPIGLATVRGVLEKAASRKMELVGAIDIHPEKVGKDVGTLAGVDPAGIPVEADAAQVLGRVQPDVVLHTTSSFIPGIVDQLMLCAQANAHVVSSTEELLTPWLRHPDAADKLDQVAKENHISILGTGVNPGFAMDTLALIATAPCLSVDRIRVDREVDAGFRRLPLQRKVGAGITVKEFRERQETGTFGHIGLVESLRMLETGLNWTFDSVVETLDPVVSSKHIETKFLTVEPGRVAVLHHQVVGFINGEDALVLNLRMFVGADNPHDAVRIEGNPPIDMKVNGGIYGDTATVAALINAVPLVVNAPSGLQTILDLPVPRAFGTG